MIGIEKPHLSRNDRNIKTALKSIESINKRWVHSIFNLWKGTVATLTVTVKLVFNKR